MVSTKVKKEIQTQISEIWTIFVLVERKMKIPCQILLPLPSEVSGTSQTRPPTYTTLRKFGYFTSN